jgi:hypothetical protein
MDPNSCETYFASHLPEGNIREGSGGDGNGGGGDRWLATVGSGRSGGGGGDVIPGTVNREQLLLNKFHFYIVVYMYKL